MIAALEKAEALARHAPSDRHLTVLSLTDEEAWELVEMLTGHPRIEASPWQYLEGHVSTLKGFRLGRLS